MATVIVCVRCFCRIRVLHRFDEFDMREGKVSGFALQFALPLTVDVRFRHQNDVAHLQLESGLVVGVWHTRLFDACVRWQFALKRLTVKISYFHSEE